MHSGYARGDHFGPPAARIVVCEDTIRSLRQRRTHSMSQLDTMFASRSVPRHLVRGALGLPMMVAAFVLVPWLGPLALLLIIPAVVLLRGARRAGPSGLRRPVRSAHRRRRVNHALAVDAGPHWP